MEKSEALKFLGTLDQSGLGDSLLLANQVEDVVQSFGIEMADLPIQPRPFKEWGNVRGSDPEAIVIPAWALVSGLLERLTGERIQPPRSILGFGMATSARNCYKTALSRLSTIVDMN